MAASSWSPAPFRAIADANRAMGDELRVAADRVYPDFTTMAAEEATAAPTASNAWPSSRRTHRTRRRASRSSGRHRRHLRQADGELAGRGPRNREGGGGARRAVRAHAQLQRVSDGGRSAAPGPVGRARRHPRRHRRIRAGNPQPAARSRRRRQDGVARRRGDRRPVDGPGRHRHARPPSDAPDHRPRNRDAVGGAVGDGPRTRGRRQRARQHALRAAARAA